MGNTKKMILTAMFTALTAVGAFIKIPIPYVPIVLQGLFVMLAGIILGSKWGALSQIAYVLIGLAGIPVFTGGGGIGYVLQPTFGYLLGFIAGAYATGYIVEHSAKKDIKTIGLACLCCILITYIIGVPYLAIVLKTVLNKSGAVSYALWTGFLVTLPGDIIKAIFATLLSIRLLPAIDKLN